MLLEELAPAVTEQHAKSISDDDAPNRSRLEHVEENARMSMIIYDTDWQSGPVKQIPDKTSPRLENARDTYPVPIHFDQARVHQPRAVLAREHYEELERSNEEMAQLIEERTIPSDHSVEQIEEQREWTTARAVNQAVINDHQTNEATSELSDLYEDPLPLERSIESTSGSADPHFQTRTQSPELVLCQPTGHQLDHSQEQTGSLSDDSLLIRHQQFLTTKAEEATILENPLRSTATLTLNYPHQNQNINPPWQRVFDEHIAEPPHQSQLHLQTQHVSPRFLPTISPAAEERALNLSENYASEFRQTPLLHENVRVDSFTSMPLLPSAHIQQSQPVYRVRSQQISSTDDPEYASISSLHPQSPNLMQANTRPSQPTGIQPPPIPIDIEIRVRPTYSETSSLLDMESFLNRFEDSLEPEQHLPLVDQVSLSYTTSLRSVQDDTQRAIERYEAEHPFFSRSLPLEWIQPSVLPHDEQLMEQWIVEKNLDSIQQQVELSTNTECASAIAIATDACATGERFEEEEKSTSPETYEQQNHLVVSAVLVSHCSPTSDYETDSLDKDNEMTSTTASIEGDVVAPTTPSTAMTTPFETVLTVPVEYLMETLNVEPEEHYLHAKDLLLSIGFGEELHCAYESELEHPDHPLMFSPHHERELLDIFFEPAPFRVPVVNEISIYQISLHHDYPTFAPSNSLLPLIHTDESLATHQYHSDGQNILSIGQMHEPSDTEEHLETFSPGDESPSSIDRLHIQSSSPFSETFVAQIHSPPTIIEHEEEEKQAVIDYTPDDQSSDSILPDVLPTEVQLEVKHGCTEYRRTARADGGCLHVQSLQSMTIEPFVVDLRRMNDTHFCSKTSSNLLLVLACQCFLLLFSTNQPVCTICFS